MVGTRLCNENIPSCYRAVHRIQKRGGHLDKPQAPQHNTTGLLHKEHKSMLHSDGAHVYRPSQIDGQENVRPSQPQGAILLPVVVDIMLQMARALKYMHGKGVAHLDIKPSNTLATPASVPELADQGYVDVKLVDFGEAKPLSTLSSSTCTMHTANIGTTQYRAPELFQVSNNCCTRVCILEVLDMVRIVQDWTRPDQGTR